MMLEKSKSHAFIWRLLRKVCMLILTVEICSVLAYGLEPLHFIVLALQGHYKLVSLRIWEILNLLCENLERGEHRSMVAEHYPWSWCVFKKLHPIWSIGKHNPVAISRHPELPTCVVIVSAHFELVGGCKLNVALRQRLEESHVFFCVHRLLDFAGEQAVLPCFLLNDLVFYDEQLVVLFDEIKVV